MPTTTYTELGARHFFSVATTTTRQCLRTFVKCKKTKNVILLDVKSDLFQPIHIATR